MWNKALSDFDVRSKSAFVSQANYKGIWKENLAIYQKSLRAFFQALPKLVKVDNKHKTGKKTNSKF